MVPTYAIDNEAGIPTRGMLRTDLSVEMLSRDSSCHGICRLTQSKVSGKKKTKRQEGEANEELTVFADSWDERVAGGTLPDLMQ